MSVRRCSQCNVPLTDSDVSTGACPVCHGQLSGIRIIDRIDEQSSFPAATRERHPQSHAAAWISGGFARPRQTLATPWARLGAVIVDNVLALVVALPGLALIIAGAVMAEQNKQGTGPSQDMPVLSLLGMLLFVVLSLVLAVYQIVLLSTKGQSLGKKFCKVRIVNYPDGGNPGFVKVILVRGLVNILIGSCVPFYPLIDVLFIFGEERRCVHDLIAGTKVVVA